MYWGVWGVGVPRNRKRCLAARVFWGRFGCWVNIGVGWWEWCCDFGEDGDCGFEYFDAGGYWAGESFGLRAVAVGGGEV